MYLVDTNVWLERLLDQDRAGEVGQFLAQTPTRQLLISDFSLHSIGVILGRLGEHHVLPRFVEDVFVRGGVCLATLAPGALPRVVEVMDRFNLDFDDAYQYVATEQFQATMVSFDRDFDRTDRGRQTPAMILSA